MSQEITPLEKSLIACGKPQRAKAVIVYVVTEFRNEWIDWKGNTDKRGRVWPEKYASLEEAKKNVEQSRTPGSSFEIDETVGLVLIYKLGGVIFTSFEEASFSLAREWIKDVEPKSLLRVMLDKIRTNNSSRFFKYTYSTLKAPKYASYQEGQKLYKRSSSGSGAKKNSLAWSVTVSNFNPSHLFSLSKDINGIRLTSSVKKVAPSLDEASSIRDLVIAPESLGISATALSSLITQGEDKEIEEVKIAPPSQSTTSLSDLKDEPELLVFSPPLEPTAKEQVIQARVGQDIFKERVALIEEGCRLTGLKNITHLRASHIKPWRDSNEAERLDGNNGLLLSPHVDHLFDQGYITFSDEGRVLVSSELDKAVLAVWKLDTSKKGKLFNSEQKKYLAYHRQRIFKI